MPCCSSEMSLPWSELKGKPRVSKGGNHSENLNRQSVDRCNEATSDGVKARRSSQQSEGAKAAQRQRRDAAQGVVAEDPETTEEQGVKNLPPSAGSEPASQQTRVNLD